MKTSIRNKKSRNLLAHNGIKQGNKKSQVKKNSKHVSRTSRRILKGGRVKDVVLANVSEELYKEGQKCDYDGIKALFSKEITDPKVFNDNLQCICPLYRFNEFVNERLINNNFFVQNEYGDIILFNFVKQNDSGDYECLLFKLDNAFTVRYEKTDIIDKQFAEKVKKINTYEKFLDLTYDNFGDNFGVALTHLYHAKNIWPVYMYNDDVIKPFIQNLYYIPNPNEKNKIFQNGINVVSIMIFLNLFAELENMLNAESDLLKSINIASDFRNEEEPKLREFFMGKIKENKENKALISSLENAKKEGFTKTILLDNYLKLMIEFFDSGNVKDKRLDKDKDMYLYKVLTSSNYIEEYVRCVITVNKLQQNTIAYDILVLIPGIISLIKDIILLTPYSLDKKDYDLYKYIMYGCNNLIIGRDIKAFKKAYSASSKPDSNRLPNNLAANNKGKKTKANKAKVSDIVKSIKRYMGDGKINYNETDRFEYNYVYFMKQIIDFMMYVREFRIMMFTRYPTIVGQDCFLKEVLNMYYLDFIRNYNTTKNLFPISISSHVQSYNYASRQQNENFNKNQPEKNITISELQTVKATNLFGMDYTYKIIPWNSVKFDTPEHGQLLYATCAETTILNTMMYLLYDKDVKDITLENIQKYNANYPNNKVKAYFNENLVKQDSIPLELESKLSTFCLNLNELRNIKYLNFDKYEVSGDINNFIAVMLVIAGIDITGSSVDANKDLFIKLFSEFGKIIDPVNIVYDSVGKSGYIVIDNLIALSNTGTHIEMNLYTNLDTSIIPYCNYLHYNIESLITDDSIGYNADFDRTSVITMTKKYINADHAYANLYDMLVDIPQLNYSILQGKTLLFLSIVPTSKIEDFNTFIDPSDSYKNTKFNLHVSLGRANDLNGRVITANDFDKPNILILQLLNQPGIEFNLNIGPNQFNNLLSLTLSKDFNGSISPDSLVNCVHLIFEGGIDSKFNHSIGPNQFPKVEKLILGNFNSTIDRTALGNCKILNLGRQFNHPIVENQFNSVEVIRLSDAFMNTIHEKALQNCKVFVIDGDITNETLTKNFMKTIETIIIQRGSCGRKISSCIIEKIIDEQQNKSLQKLSNNTSDLYNNLFKKEVIPVKPFLELGIFPNLKTLIIEDNRYSNDDGLLLFEYLSTNLTSKPTIYFRNSSREYEIFEKIEGKVIKSKKDDKGTAEHFMNYYVGASGILTK